MKYLVNICRLLVGVLFIISGLIKANDPLGFSYKLEEYFSVFGWDFFKPMALFMSVAITVFEIICGVAVLVGSRMKLYAWLLMLMIVFFTFLTFYSAYFNKVTDCGCFGDALHLTPWQSFSKDIILFILILPIFLWRSKIQPLFSVKMDNIVMLAATALSLWFNMFCINHLPVIDFRPYKIGTNIVQDMAIPEGAPVDEYETKLVYLNKKTGEKKEFTTAEYTKASYLWEDTLTWAWDTTISNLVKEGFKPKIHDFSIADDDGNKITDEVLKKPGYTLFVVNYNIAKSDKSHQSEINKLVSECDKNKIPVIGLTASVAEKEAFRHEVQAAYPYYTCDETALKTMVRSNPGLVLMKDGVVQNMWHHNDVPDFASMTK
jgi:uncharacterized membrane protein YphA (DoxX/SURF4 family)